MNSLTEILNQFIHKDLQKTIVSYLISEEWQIYNKNKNDSLLIYMSPSFKILSLRQMVEKDKKNLTKNLKEKLFCDEEMFDNEELIQDDFVVVLIDFYTCNEQLILFHGFPGDNSSGLLLTKNYKLIISVDENSETKDVSKKCPLKYKITAKCFILWYKKNYGENKQSLILSPK